MVQKSLLLARITLTSFLIVVLVILFFEVLLRGVGLLSLSPQFFKNFKFTESSLTILTTGESTTADVMADKQESWPRLLESRLIALGYNAQVVNIALPASSTNEQLRMARVAVDFFRPDIVISMWGVNDNPHLWIDETFVHQATGFYSRLKIVKLIRYLKTRSEIRWREKVILAEKMKLLKYQEALSDIQNFRIERFTKGKTNMETAKLYFEMGLLVLPSLGENPSHFSLSHKYFSDSLQSGYYSLRQIEFLLLTDLVLASDCSGTLRFIQKNAIELSEMALRRLWGCVKEAQAQLAEFTQKFFPGYKALIESQTKPTKVNYQALARHVHDHKGCLVAMQYPNLPLEDLIDYFQDYPDRDQVRFVSNQNNFQKAINKESYSRLFYDHFTGAFGHLTRRGVELIVENLLLQLSDFLASKDCVSIRSGLVENSTDW